IHDLVPGGGEIANELLLRVVARVDLCEGAKLGVRAENEVDAAGGPLEVALSPAATLESLGRVRVRTPLRVHVEQADEKVVRQRSAPFGENAEIGLSGVGAERAHAAYEYGHFRSTEGQHEGPIDQQLLGGHG